MVSLSSIIINDMLDPANNDTKHLKKLFIKFNLVQLIKDPTRTTATTKTIIDHIITNYSNKQEKKTCRFHSLV